MSIEEICKHPTTTPSWDYVTCNKCGWISPCGQSRGPNGGFFPSMTAVKEFDKYGTYHGMSEVKPLIRNNRP